MTSMNILSLFAGLMVWNELRGHAVLQTVYVLYTSGVTKCAMNKVPEKLAID